MLRVFFNRLSFSFFKRWGKNYLGRSVSFHLGGGKVLRYLAINFLNFLNCSSFLLDRVFYYTRYIFVSSLISLSGFIFYSLSLENQKPGDIVFFGFDLKKSLLSPYIDGSNFLVKNMPKHTILSLVEFYPNLGFSLVRAKGNFSVLLDNNKELNEAIILLSSGWRVIISGNCFASIGQLSAFAGVFKKNAGFNRRRGKKPVVRGVAMNPVDHPHGGGEGKTSGGRPSVSPWGKLTKGLPTVGNRRIYSKIEYRFIK